MSKALLHEANQCLFPQQAQGGRGRGLLSQVWDGVGVGIYIFFQRLYVRLWGSEKSSCKRNHLKWALKGILAIRRQGERESRKIQEHGQSFEGRKTWVCAIGSRGLLVCLKFAKDRRGMK